MISLAAVCHCESLARKKKFFCSESDVTYQNHTDSFLIEVIFSLAIATDTYNIPLYDSQLQ